MNTNKHAVVVFVLVEKSKTTSSRTALVEKMEDVKKYLEKNKKNKDLKIKAVFGDGEEHLFVFPMDSKTIESESVSFFEKL